MENGAVDWDLARSNKESAITKRASPSSSAGTALAMGCCGGAGVRLGSVAICAVGKACQEFWKGGKKTEGNKSSGNKMG